MDDWEVERERVEDPIGGQELKTKLGVSMETGVQILTGDDIFKFR